MNGHYNGVLTCDKCGLEAVHELEYAGRILVRSVCTNCGHETQPRGDDVWNMYIHDIEQRVASKPLRMWRRFRRHPLEYGLGLPASVLAKPLRMCRELRLVTAGGRRKRGMPDE